MEQVSQITLKLLLTRKRHREHFLLVAMEDNLEQLGHNITTLHHYYCGMLNGVSMNFPYSFIHIPEKKKEPEQLPLYIELEPPMLDEEKIKEDQLEYQIIVIEL